MTITSVTSCKRERLCRSPFFQTDWSAQLTEEKSCALETWYKSMERLPAASSWTWHFCMFFISYLHFRMLHCLSPFRCHVSGAAKAQVFTFTGNEHTDIPSILKLLFRVLTDYYLQVPYGSMDMMKGWQVSSGFRINLQVIAGVAVFYFLSLWGLFVSQRTFEELVLITTHEVSQHQKIPQSIEKLFLKNGTDGRSQRPWPLTSDSQTQFFHQGVPHIL